MLLLAIGYGAGLATGLAHLTAPALIIAVLVIALIVGRRSWWLPLLPALAIGMVVGTRARMVAHGWCAAKLPLGERRLRVRAIDPIEGSGRVAIIGGSCAGLVVARWPKTAHLAAGLSVAVTARWTPAERPLHRPDGMLLVSVVDSAGGAPTAVERGRTGIVRATHTLFGARAPLANALLAGWRGELDPELKAAFASAGLMHLLAISGFHLGCLAGWLFLLLRLGGLRRHGAALAAALGALGYTAFLGWPIAALRASLLLALVGWCHWRQRQVMFSALLGSSVLLILLVSPWAVTEPGTWLSIAGGVGVSSAVRWSDQAIGSAWWLRSMSGSVGAVLATAPVAAAVFGQVAVAGVVLNFAGIPILAALLPVLFGAVLLHPALPVLSSALAASGNGLLALLELLVKSGAHAPGSAGAGASGWSAAWPWFAVLFAAAWAIHGNSTWREALRRLAWSGTVALLVALPWAGARVVAPDDHRLTLRFVDVGQGDAALIRTPSGHWIEVDAGPTGEGRDAGRRVIAPMLAQLGVRNVDLFVLSHAHRDHVGGGAGVLDRIPLGLAIEPGELFADSAYEGWLAALAAHHVRWRAARAGTRWMIDGVTFRVLHPPTPWLREGEDLNEDSIVLEVEYGDFRALLMGDAGFVAESALAGTLPRVDVLKVGHHGSRTATSAAFLAEVRPQMAVVSVGRNNYGHPSPEALARLAAAATSVWRTDVEGTVLVTTNGKGFTVKGARSSATFVARH